MGKILAFDASGDGCSVTLSLSDQTEITLRSEEAKSHATHLLPFTQQLLEENSLKLSDIGAIACAIGPGSFTGLRIALSTAQGLAYAANKPIIPVNSLAAMTVSAKITDPNRLCLPLVDARMGEAYWGGYYVNGAAIANAEALLGRADDFESALEQLLSSSINGAPSLVIALGNAWGNIAFAANALTHFNLEYIEQCAPDASAVARLARTQLQLGHVEKPQRVDLCYCRNTVAWNKRTRIRAQ